MADQGNLKILNIYKHLKIQELKKKKKKGQAPSARNQVEVSMVGTALTWLP